jgi:hypothetical protein
LVIFSGFWYHVPRKIWQPCRQLTFLTKSSSNSQRTGALKGSHADAAIQTGREAESYNKKSSEKMFKKFKI